MHHRRLDHRTNNPLCRQNENYCITELGIATVYVCNAKVDGTGMLSSHIGSSVNVVDIFNYAPRRRRSHGQSHYKATIVHDVFFVDLRPFIQKPFRMYQIRTKHLSLLKLHFWYNSCVRKKTLPIRIYINTSNRLGYCPLQTFQAC